MSYSYSNFHPFSPQTSSLNFSGTRCIFLTGKFGNATGNGQQREGVTPIKNITWIKPQVTTKHTADPQREHCVPLASLFSLFNIRR